jgi:hypothetical protein
MKNMKRSHAVQMIDQIRVMLASGTPTTIIALTLEQEFQIPPLVPCTGEAHSNPHIDNCRSCAPRWGWVGDKIKIT